MAPSEKPTTAQMKKSLAQFQKGTKAKERVYHGTSNLEGLKSFDPAMTGNGTDQLGSGFYFTTHPDEASGYASMPNHPSYPKAGAGDSPGMVAAHLALKKPIKIGPKGQSLNDARINLSHDQVKQIMGHAPNILDRDESPLGNHVDTSRGVTPKMIHDIAKLYTGNQLYALENDIFPGHPTEYRHALHKVTGHDGVVKDFGDGHKHYVAWFPEQVKSAIGNRGTYDPNDPDITKAQGGAVQYKNPFDYENADHVENVANIAAKHKDFSRIPDAAKHLASTLSTGNWKHIEDPRVQDAIKKAGHDGYHVAEKHGKEAHATHKAKGGNVQPSMAQMKMALAQKSSSVDLKRIGVNEAPNMSPKHFFPPDTSDIGMPSPGGVATPRGMPIGGIDMSQQQGGQQLMPTPPQPPQGAAPGQPPAPGTPPAGTPPGAPQGPTPPMGNMLSMTPQGQAMNALGGQKMAKGGQPSVDQMKTELAAKASPQDKRVTIKAEGPGGVKGIVVPKHLIEGNPKAGAEGLKNMMDARAKVYGGEHREPLNLGQVAKIHKQTLEDHFAKPLEEQKSSEQEALNKIREAKFIKHNRDTLDESEKLDTVEHEHDEEGRSHVGYASKGIAGHALFPKGHGKDMDYKVINTCPGQTDGCGGGKNAEGIVDTKQGTCFAPNAESQYAAAVSRRAGHAIAKHDPAMTRDWIIAHTGSMRNAAGRADKQNKRMLYRPNVVDETDVSSRHVIRHLNEQRKMDDKPPIIANSYGKTNELHDPENGYHVTHSNVGPKVKKGQEISENISRDKARVRNTVMAADNQGDFKNEQGNKTPPKGSYMVTDVKRGSPMAKKMEGAITHAKYWTTGRPENELSHEERAEGPEGHFSGSGRKTTEDKAHYGHRTHEGLRYDYQRQHVLHPRLVQVGKNDDGTPHIIPTDSRFKDTDFLPKDRYKTKNGKEAGHILMTTPTESTSNIGHQTSFTHNVSDKHIEHAMKNNGEYEIDKPEDQAKAKGKEYAAPQAIKFYAEGGTVGGRHPGFANDDFHAFPEQNVVAQRHLAMRHGEDEHKPAAQKKAVVVHKNTGTMRYEMSMNKKAK